MVFIHTTAVNNDADRRTLKDVVLAAQNGIIVAIVEAAYQIGERFWDSILEGGPLPLPRL